MAGIGKTVAGHYLLIITLLCLQHKTPKKRTKTPLKVQIVARCAYFAFLLDTTVFLSLYLYPYFTLRPFTKLQLQKNE